MLVFPFSEINYTKFHFDLILFKSPIGFTKRLLICSVLLLLLLLLLLLFQWADYADTGRITQVRVGLCRLWLDFSNG